MWNGRPSRDRICDCVMPGCNTRLRMSSAISRRGLACSKSPPRPASHRANSNRVTGRARGETSDTVNQPFAASTVLAAATNPRLTSPSVRNPGRGGQESRSLIPAEWASHPRSDSGPEIFRRKGPHHGAFGTSSRIKNPSPVAYKNLSPSGLTNTVESVAYANRRLPPR